ncbi:MAG: hypothetical protein R3F43_12255 [bacterium]
MDLDLMLATDDPTPLIELLEACLAAAGVELDEPLGDLALTPVGMTSAAERD